jgi:transcriptional regulator with XRE-family HTH domain
MTGPEPDDPRDPIDIHVGGRIRALRRSRNLSQADLANVLGLTFQQVQKYERASNRVSASKLYAIAAALQTGVTFFFEGLADPAAADGAQGDDDERAVFAFLTTGEGLELATLFPQIGSSQVRRRILELVRSTVEAEADDPVDPPALS